MAAKKTKDETVEVLTISPPNMCVLTQRIVGTAPYVQARFAEKARHQMREKHEAGSTAKKGGKRDARDFNEDYEGSLHRGPNGEYGMPASAFRAAAISACRVVNFKMTLAKLGLFIKADFYDPRDGTPLVAIQGDPKSVIHPVRNTTGVADLRCRAMWAEWAVTLRIEFDGDMFKVEDVINLIDRIGAQVGVGEGRPDSKKSAGMDWGKFRRYGEFTVERPQLI